MNMLYPGRMKQACERLTKQQAQKPVNAPAPKFRVIWVDPETGTQYEKEYVMYGTAENCKMKAEKDYPGAKVFITDMAGVVINL